MRAGCAQRLAGGAALLVLAACGQKGPPLAPLHFVPDAVGEVSVRRVADTVRLRFVLPTRNVNGPGPVDLDRVEIYAMTVAPGAPPPANRELLTKDYLAGQIAVRPVPAEGEATQPAKEGDTRPEPGAAVTFDEELDAAKMTPVPSKTPRAQTVAQQGQAAAQVPTPGVDQTPAADASAAAAPIPQTAAGAAVEPSKPAATGPPPPTPAAAGLEPVPGLPIPVPPLPGAAATTTKPAAPPAPKYPVRVYVVRGVTKSGRFGPPSTRMEVALIPVPSPPTAVSSRVTESAVVIEWRAPTQPPLPVSYNLYRAEDPMQPINTAPVAAASYEYTSAALGEQACFQLRGIALAGAVPTEGPLSAETCVTPRDVFAPEAPKRLDAVPTPGQISLIWEANTETDLAGYLVLRGDAPDGPLQPITPAPIRETSYRDATVKPGVRYIYAVVAVDTATPPNVSAQSPRVDETAR